ncbi:MAG: methyltransferase domain-containing protein [Elusimicrobiales bacterium]|nr:methyltransferase domain-containing protein [Elusimicrobiales bacterium]
MLNQFLRYLPLSLLVKREAPARLLEVGGGAAGLRAYLPGLKITGVDPCFGACPAAETADFTPIDGSVLALPFPDGAFPVVVCSDALEHVDAGDRQKAVLELWRVCSGKVFLSFPVKESYGPWEERLFNYYKRGGKEIPGWLEEHRRKGLPEEREIAALLAARGIPFKTVPNENNLLHFAAMVLDSSFLAGALGRLTAALAPDVWDRGAASAGSSLLRALFLPLRLLPRFTNFGSVVRKIFILDRGAAAGIAGYYDRNPGMISSPFGGIGSSPDYGHPYLTETLADLGVGLAGKKVLDAGCGSGWFARYCKARGVDYTGADISETSVALSRKVTPNIVLADSQALPFEDASFDYVFCIDSFEHVPDQARAAAEFRRVLRAGGAVFLSVPNYSNVAGMVKWFEEAAGFYGKDSWAPFDRWAPQALEQFMTPGRVRRVFGGAGFKKFSVIGGRNDLLEGIFPWIAHRRMPYAYSVKELFMRFQKPLERFHRLSLHNFWLIEK